MEREVIESAKPFEEKSCVETSRANEFLAELDSVIAVRKQVDRAPYSESFDINEIYDLCAKTRPVDDEQSAIRCLRVHRLT